MTSKLTTIVQVMLERNHEGDYAPNLEWANVGYVLTPAFTVRAGRLALSAFMTSDHRKVGFANPWVRPPGDIYSLVPVFTLDGVDASYRLHTGNWTSTLNASFGGSKDPKLVDHVASALADSGMDPELLELEVCESILARDALKTVPILEDLKRLGTRITVDNFGTGYSSLSVLRGLPLDTIKIDRLFLRADAGDTMAHEVTDALVAMGRSLSSSVVVHGVETREQADYLRSHSCHQVQGFFFDRPSRATDIAALLRGEPVTAPSTGSS